MVPRASHTGCCGLRDKQTNSPISNDICKKQTNIVTTLPREDGPGTCCWTDSEHRSSVCFFLLIVGMFFSLLLANGTRNGKGRGGAGARVKQGGGGVFYFFSREEMGGAPLFYHETTKRMSTVVFRGWEGLGLIDYHFLQLLCSFRFSLTNRRGVPHPWHALDAELDIVLHASPK